jgi:hypothetical protein
VIIEFHVLEADRAQLHVLLRALTALNMLYLKANPNTPDLKSSGVVYKQQPAGCERFLTIPLIMRAGNADCDQLAPWRAAELRVRHGIKALPEVRKMGAHLWHVYVRYPDGKVEDPSAHLGMRIPPRLAALGRKILKQKNHHAPTTTSTRAGRAWHGWH